MLEVNEEVLVVKQKFQRLLYFAKNLGFETILDVAPNVFEQFNISYNDLGFFYKLMQMAST
ncbi:hypothetical protein RV14_GL000679 [Enterococcus ratti]|uniref:6-phospho-N-acetylmuramidase N-terminal domain-containing protein n=1 Tax=Enterococcus ratti TaxID=150033 RepID=A0A1L8WG64_9ENTE|nr:hypothetical protein RV14_GL000679 [Enterococcus ratti]